ncbi:MAG: MoxR family ATPase [Caldilineaceae bacterium]|nr:MoxR family ATPase [Caldilinea sp.]MCB9113466.1 MoxR family ATPase [Caldilineaceae bacterium]MCB9122861.1 MoxR family ATPase [Caldilineaceae bacterium]MCB9124376.1 MoxR family ATPase [Caldilineaceae bacterium]
MPASLNFTTIDDLQAALARRAYVSERGLATAIFLALKLGRPLLLEGEAGVGKTEVAKVLAALLDRPLLRLQCYEGLDLQSAAYEWNYSRQILQIRLMEASGHLHLDAAQQQLFGPDFLLKRPLLQAIDSGSPAPVLLIDELDRADEEFEAFLLELLSDFQITIPELGTIKAAEPPIVIITSNRTREVHDALRRRCLYHWIDFPSFDKELAIVAARAPQAGDALARQIVAFVQAVRREELYKLPGVAETLDWLAALVALGRPSLDRAAVSDTLGVLLKYREDIERIEQRAGDLLKAAGEHGRA